MKQNATAKANASANNVDRTESANMSSDESKGDAVKVALDDLTGI